MSESLHQFGLPDDGPRLAALLLAALTPLLLPRRLRTRRAARWFIALCCVAAAGLSAGYVHHYLRGGPRIIDASAYLLQARAMVQGWLAWPLALPDHAVIGRFLVRTPHLLGIAGVAAGPGVAVIFPPGYPAVLAAGVALGAPMAVGPVLGAGLVLATADLAGRVERDAARAGLVPPARRAALGWGAAPLAALLSTVCVALRYHTADTMSHGLAALCFIVALSSAHALGATPHRLGRWREAGVAALLGLAAGWLFVTRPASAMALLPCAVLLGRRTGRAGRAQRPRLAVALALTIGALPGVALFFLHQYGATGDPTTTAQAAYYAVSDGPPGCFTYGFGEAIGCRGEHGTFVRHRLQEGYGVLEALGTTARRLEMHVGDPFGWAPLFWLVPLGAWLGRRARTIGVLGLAIVLQIACYAPFYFDGNYPGGGARMLADVLPVEHVLGSFALMRLAVLAPRGRPSLRQLLSATVVLSLAGFAFQTGRAHAALRGREGGRPMFEPSVARNALPPGALLFVSTDHGFNLAYHPGSTTLRVARRHGDGLDRLTWEALGRPLVYRYDFDLAGRRPPEIVGLDFAPAPTDELDLRIEGESLWPPAAQRAGWAWPRHLTASCASQARGLAFTPAAGTAAGAAPLLRLRLPARALAGRQLRVTTYRPDDVAAAAVPARWLLHADGRTIAEQGVPPGRGCVTAGPMPVPPRVDRLTLELRSAAPLYLDRIDAPAPGTVATGPQ